ncbi:DUF413 domain-containing protein [Shewanella sp. D64]|uniref:DUF413 domain-containing protein n=1 Tax=unclassified Shewanella TaxID=196818 RepID=UPI0022BA2139|nr:MULTISPECIES: DUF413 domain-containing protein [unclassified Shewanella]MEC4728515.1 DUF413 domain-containing protein [Shewanella sp. D64]MEC4740304.1 DUF413 domain-containing protein [Shewanella sp. E94]WBJ94282.1 DUF413 domain-containing protein [Shewanella sp. MTB7]
MSEESIRCGQKCFIDNTNFPRGFRKCGDFSLAESELLSLYGETLLNLESGLFSPQTLEEDHFIRVLTQPDQAKTKLELVWMKYIKLSREPRQFHTLNSTYSYKAPAEMMPITNIKSDESAQLNATI